MATQNTLTGTLFAGRYRVTRKIGGGGMADVYLAEDQELGRRVAIKILHGRYANDEQFVERFRREATHAAGLSHPNIVSIFDRGETEGSYFMVMEYVEGRTLKELIRSRGPCPVNVAIGIHEADPVGAPLRASQRRRAPRHQAAQRDRGSRGRRQGDGLRDRARRSEPDDGGGRDHRHGAVPLPGAGARRAGRPDLRPLLDRHRPLRAPHRERALLGRDAGRDRDEAPVRGPGRPFGASPGGAGRPRPGGPARSLEGAARSLPVGRGDGRRPRDRRPRRARAAGDRGGRDRGPRRRSRRRRDGRDAGHAPPAHRRWVSASVRPDPEPPRARVAVARRARRCSSCSRSAASSSGGRSPSGSRAPTRSPSRTSSGSGRRRPRTTSRPRACSPASVRSRAPTSRRVSSSRSNRRPEATWSRTASSRSRCRPVGRRSRSRPWSGRIATPRCGS